MSIKRTVTIAASDSSISQLEAYTDRVVAAEIELHKLGMDKPIVEAQNKVREARKRLDSWFNIHTCTAYQAGIDAKDVT